MGTHKNAWLAASVAGIALCSMAASSQAVVFTTSDIAGDHILFNYNTRENTHYINGVSTNKSLLETVDSADHINSNGEAIIVDTGYANAGTSRSLVYSYTVPTNYVISSVSLNNRMTCFAGSGVNNYIELSWSVDGTTWHDFDSFVSDNNAVKDVLSSANTLTLTGLADISSMNITTFYLKATFDFSNGSGADYASNLQLARTDGTGNAASYFKVDIGVTSVPEVSSIAMLASAGGLLLRRRK